jgi:hypothetical protein
MANIREAIEACVEENEIHINSGKFIGWREIEVAIS